MLTLKLLREHPDFVIERLKVKNFDATTIVSKVLELDRERRNLQGELDANLAQQKTLSGEIGRSMREGKKKEAEAAKISVAGLKSKSDELHADFEKAEREMLDQIVLLPNIPYKLVPKGKDSSENLVVRTGGPEVKLPEGALPHWELARKYNIIDFDLGVKITGAGFPVYIGQGAKLQRALVQFFLDRNVADGYLEVEPPFMVNEASGFGTGQIPDKEAQMYHIGLDNFYMIPTAEVPVTNIYRDEILPMSEFPIKMTAFTQCFRREAGSYGKDVRGLNRLHQFDKVECVWLSLPDKSYDALDSMVDHVESLVKDLGLPYRIVRLCGGDLSFTSAITYDFEVFSAAQKRWLEVSSVSNFESYQANRLKLRYRDENGKIQLAHTLNGSSLALPRIVAALLENNQYDGGIMIPEILRPYTGFDRINGRNGRKL
ncbi:MAG: serine--tRNA ligase [Bacteroidales bacterium]|jgi:seryl-tRNA synthetase|nr:serine--tRNA ligase [Bacteroidales bacterium]MCI2121592.1 serine--tRNA ligase [Bacteroidales bacterium]MCI2145690.1 serine--tRNA ligase [Bacteroidales bacterium]